MDPHCDQKNPPKMGQSIINFVPHLCRDRKRKTADAVGPVGLQRNNLCPSCLMCSYCSHSPIKMQFHNYISDKIEVQKYGSQIFGGTFNC